MYKKRSIRVMADRALFCYRWSMKTINQQDYIKRLVAVGLRPADAAVLVNDFWRELDFDGLDAYCAELERLHVAAVSK